VIPIIPIGDTQEDQNGDYKEANEKSEVSHYSFHHGGLDESSRNHQLQK
jgi:hypothetical protein